MDSVKSLGAMPLKLFTSSRVAGTNTAAKKSQSVRRNSFARRNSVGRRMSLPCLGVGRRKSLPCGSSQKVPDSWLRVYQAELKKERKRQQAVLAKKHAERSIRKTHFRSHHCLPRKTTPSRKSSAKDESFFGAFQSLSLDGLKGGSHGSTSISIPAGDQCKVM